MELMKAYLKIMMLQLVIIILAVLSVTGIRFFDQNLFNEIVDTYSFYASYDTTTNLVYDGVAD